MFEDLDDPTPPFPGTATREGVDARVQSRRAARVARRRQAALGGVGAVVAAVAITLVVVAARPDRAVVDLGPSTTDTSASTSSTATATTALGSTVTSTPTAPTPTTTPSVSPPPESPTARVDDLDFTTATSGWAFGHGLGCGACIVLAHTTDGGATWRSQAGPKVDAQHVRAGGDGTLYVYGPDLAVSGDNGASWSTALANVQAVEPEPKDVWAITSCTRPCDGALTLERSTDDGRTWSKGRLPADAKGDHVELVRHQSGEAWLLVSDFDTATVKLWHTSDGSSWQPLTAPCDADHSLGATFTVVDSLHLWLGCNSDNATIQQGKEVFHSSDGGDTWQGTPDPGLTGHLASLGAPDELHVFMALGRAGLQSYTVGDPLWTDAIRMQDVCDNGLSPVRFVDPSHAWVGSAGPSCDKAIVWRTADGGAHWAAVPVG